MVQPTLQRVLPFCLQLLDTFTSSHTSILTQLHNEKEIDLAPRSHQG